jgi:hypothetical protein
MVDIRAFIIFWLKFIYDPFINIIFKLNSIGKIMIYQKNCVI